MAEPPSTRKNSICSKIFRCCYGSSSRHQKVAPISNNPIHPPEPHTVQSVPADRLSRTRPQSQIFPESRLWEHREAQDRILEQYRTKKKKEREAKLEPVFKIQTKFKKEEILISATMPDKAKKDVYKYLCPICFRYFSHILEFGCCSNYICFFCVGDLNDYWGKKQKEGVRLEEERQLQQFGDDVSENNSNLLFNLVSNNEIEGLEANNLSVNGPNQNQTNPPREIAGCIFCRDDFNVVQDCNEDHHTRKYEDSPQVQEKNYRVRLEKL